MPIQYLTPDMWVDRTEGLIAVAEELGARAGDARRRTALAGLRLLSVFARKQFQFIGRGFAENGPLAPDPQFPPAFLLEATIHQVAYDLDVFMSVLGQREKAVGTPAMQKTLAMADRLAADALAPAVRHRLVEHEVGVRRPVFEKAPAMKHDLAQPILVGDLQELGRDDLVGVDVVDRQRDLSGGKGGELSHISLVICDW